MSSARSSTPKPAPGAPTHRKGRRSSASNVAPGSAEIAIVATPSTTKATPPSASAGARTPARSTDRAVWDGAGELRALLVALDSLQPHARNARKHPDRNVAAIRASFERFGQQRALVVYRFPDDRRLSVLAGNGGLQVAVQLGWTHVAATAFKGTPAEAEAYAIADNRAGGWRKLKKG